MSTLDPAAVLHEHGGLLRRMACGYERNPAERDELAQEMAIAVWKALVRYRGDGSLRAFVAKVAQFTALERLRGRRPAPGPEAALATVAGPEPGPQACAEATQRRDALMDAVQELPLGQRECVLLALEGFGNREIAQMLGTGANTVDQRLSRARSWLKKRMEQTHA